MFLTVTRIELLTDFYYITLFFQLAAGEVYNTIAVNKLIQHLAYLINNFERDYGFVSNLGYHAIVTSLWSITKLFSFSSITNNKIIPDGTKSLHDEQQRPQEGIQPIVVVHNPDWLIIIRQLIKEFIKKQQNKSNPGTIKELYTITKSLEQISFGYLIENSDTTNTSSSSTNDIGTSVTSTSSATNRLSYSVANTMTNNIMLHSDEPKVDNILLNDTLDIIIQSAIAQLEYDTSTGMYDSYQYSSLLHSLGHILSRANNTMTKDGTIQIEPQQQQQQLYTLILMITKNCTNRNILSVLPRDISLVLYGLSLLQYNNNMPIYLSLIKRLHTQCETNSVSYKGYHLCYAVWSLANICHHLPENKIITTGTTTSTVPTTIPLAYSKNIFQTTTIIDFCTFVAKDVMNDYNKNNSIFIPKRFGSLDNNSNNHNTNVGQYTSEMIQEIKLSFTALGYDNKQFNQFVEQNIK
jgi:hypothetical protein